MKKKPILSFWQLWNMSFGYVGIQFGFALQNANVSRIFETLGAKVDDIAVLWIAAPVSGLMIQPIIGHLSDKTWNRLGRRKPYFLLGAILAVPLTATVKVLLRRYIWQRRVITEPSEITEETFAVQQAQDGAIGVESMVAK